MKWLRRILTVVFTALLLFSAYKIYEYVREARESEASVETLIEKAVEERTPKEPGSLCAFLKMEGKPDWLPGFPVQIYCNRE